MFSSDFEEVIDFEGVGIRSVVKKKRKFFFKEEFVGSGFEEVVGSRDSYFKKKGKFFLRREWVFSLGAYI